jgi:hypothetical protein
VAVGKTLMSLKPEISTAGPGKSGRSRRVLARADGDDAMVVSAEAVASEVTAVPEAAAAAPEAVVPAAAAPEAAPEATPEAVPEAAPEAAIEPAVDATEAPASDATAVAPESGEPTVS